MPAFNQRGDDLASFIRGYADQAKLTDQAVRLTAMNARNELRRQIRTRFGSEGRVFAARGFAAAIIVKKFHPGWAVIDRAQYRHKRTQKFSLAWVFDQAPVVRGKRGWVAVPIKGEAPIHANGRRPMWPSEAAAAGWQLEIVAIMGKRVKLIMGRRNRFEAWRPIYYWVPPYRAAKRLDLDGLHRKHAARLDLVWADLLDKRIARRGVRKFAA